jgi:hypothetical protein
MISLTCLLQAIQIKTIICFIYENNILVDATLYDMLRLTRQNESPVSGHRYPLNLSSIVTGKDRLMADCCMSDVTD